MKKFGLVILTMVSAYGVCGAQQDPTSTLYMFNIANYNPGSVGSSGMFSATASSRQQWVGFDGAPFTTSFNFNAPFNFLGTKNGAGLTVMSDIIGFDSNISISGAYSYIMNLGVGSLGIGVNVGMINTNINPSWSIPDGSDFTPAQQDPLIPNNSETFVALDAGLGIYLKNDKYYAGFSVSHINQPKIKYFESTPYISRHYYATAGYTVQLPNPSFELLPSVWGLFNNGVVQFSATTLLEYNKKVWGGLSYRSGDALSGIVGLELYNGIKICYAYDFPLSEIRTATSGSHEIIVNYCFDFSLGKSPMQYKSIRFL
jgi:type IX secretion system PorP/SprF family membrane protein